MRTLSLAVNLPGPLAAARLHRLGAAVLKVEPPAGDPLAGFCAAWYAALREGQEVINLDLKAAGERARLDELLEGCDLLITSHRPAALARLGLSWPELHARHARLSQVAIVGYPPPRQDVAGHDLIYQAGAGLLAPPELPRSLFVDLGGAERAVSAALGLLVARERGQGAGYAEVALSEVAESLAAPLRHGLTAPGGLLGGGLPSYALYPAAEGWIAVAALEPHFLRRLQDALGLRDTRREDLAAAFLTRNPEEWERWGAEHDLPLTAVR